MPDLYSPELLSQLQAQIRAAVATGLPWLIQNAQQAYDYARSNGAQLPFDAQGNDLGGSSSLPPLPQGQQEDIASALAAVQSAPPGTVIPASGGPLPGATGPGLGGTPTPTDAPPSLESDPALAAFERALGMERSTAETNTQAQMDAIQRNLGLRLPQISQSGEYARQGISGGYETRGLLRSGQHEDALARQRQAEGNQTSAAQADAANRTAALQQALAQQETGFDTRLAEQRLAAAGRQQELTASQQQQADYQKSVSDLLAAQQRSNDQLNQRYDQAIQQYGLGGAPGYTPPAPATPAASSGDPLSGIVGMVPDPSDPDYLTKLAKLRAGG